MSFTQLAPSEYILPGNLESVTSPKISGRSISSTLVIIVIIIIIVIAVIVFFATRKYYVTGCIFNTDCSGIYKLCNVDNKKCVECLRESDCSIGKICSTEGTCL